MVAGAACGNEEHNAGWGQARSDLPDLELLSILYAVEPQVLVGNNIG